MYNAVSEFKKWKGKLERFAGWEPGRSVANQVNLGVCEASDESEVPSDVEFQTNYDQE